MINFSLSRFKNFPHQPKYAEINKIIRRSLVDKYNSVMISIAIVNNEDSRQANLEFRNKDKPTNVISLEYADSRDTFNMLTGELILADEIIVQEANEQGKNIAAHYAHMLVHGMLHLQGYDHLNDADAEEMEALEIEILLSLGVANPYIGYHEKNI